MQHISSTDARNGLAKAILLAQREPVVIQKQGHDVAVILSPQDFERMTSDNIEDFLALCNLIGQKAVSAGLTEDKLTILLKDEDI